ncbi:hypothetical protein [Natrinema sp. 1APR25-10V2]|uniref:hypothetical protein n=1 Tax=Natrinema sp. 1APR25-10V2 TaxID=2951081 RepID=UPI002876458E|nr:hypothetical protein [Natrinema sp. 1APR25-10V2]MDS0477922.1 hypothetical protein [Natrinema sp. 1APR25-10V2]
MTANDDHDRLGNHVVDRDRDANLSSGLSMCQRVPGAGVDRASLEPAWLPWSRHPRSDVRERAAKRVAKAGSCGVVLSRLVGEMHGYDAVANATYDYKHLRRYVAELEKDGYIEIERMRNPFGRDRPSERCPLLITATDALYHAIAESVLDTASRRKCPQGSRDSNGGESEKSIAKENAEARLRRRSTFETAAEWGGLIGSYGAWKLGYERTRNADRTRFTVASEASEATGRLLDAFDLAASTGYEGGAIVTGTTDPGEFETIEDAVAEITDDERRLRKWIARRLDDGMPAYIAAPEPTKWGAPHVHIALFGVDVDGEEWPSDHALHDYWLKRRGRGHQIDVEPIAVDETGSWYWVGDGPDGAGCPPAPYLAEGARSIETAARTEAGDIQAIANAYRERGSEPIKKLDPATLDVPASVTASPDAIRQAAWYWASDTRAATNGSEEIQS